MSNEKQPPRADFPVYSLDEETYFAGGKKEVFDRLADNGDLRPGAAYWVSTSHHPAASSYFDIDTLVENLYEQATDDCGEAAEDFPDMTREQTDELNKMVSEWLDTNISVSFFKVDTAPVVQMHVTEEDICEWRENQ